MNDNHQHGDFSIQFAPLQGYTEAAYRNAHSACFEGVDAYYTPFIRVEKEGFRSKDLREIDPTRNRAPRLIPQLIASTPEKAEAILSLFIEKGYKEVDINLGCPFPLIAKRHNGSGLLPYPEEVEALLRLVSRYTDLSFSVKMRLGWDSPEECLRLAPLLNEVPLRQITLHPRLGKQQYKGTTDLEAFDAFRHVCHHPLVYNGDLRTLEDIQNIRTRFPGLAGVMIGRGLLANPALALEYRQGAALPCSKKMEKIRQMHDLVFQSYEQQLEGGEMQLLSKIKAFWEYLLPDANKKLLKAIHKSNRISRYQQAVDALFYGSKHE